MNTPYQQLAATVCVISLLLTQANFAHAAELGGSPLETSVQGVSELRWELPTQETESSTAQPKAEPILLRSLASMEIPPYTLKVGEDAGYLLDEVKTILFAACTETLPALPIYQHPDKWVLLSADWSLKEGDFIDTSRAGNYELVGTLIPLEGYAFAEGFEVPTAHVFVNILPDEKWKIDHFFSDQLYGMTVSQICRLNDEAYQDGLFGMESSQIAGLTEDNAHTAEFDITWNFDAVDWTKEGSYNAIITLSLAEEFQNEYTVSDDLALQYTKTIFVADPEKLNFFVTEVSKNVLMLNSLNEPGEMHLQASYLQSDTPLSEEELSNAKFIPCEGADAPGLSFDNISLNNTFIDRGTLKRNTDYYFRFYDGQRYSNILHINDDGKTPTTSYIEGDRDGGDRDEQVPPPVTVPPPAGGNPLPPAKDEANTETGSTPPAKEEPTPAKPATSVPTGAPGTTPQEPVSIPEEDTQNYTVFSGRRLLQMQKMTDVLRVKKNHITVDMPWAWEGFSHLTEDSRFRVEILALSRSSISVEVLLDGALPITALPMTVTMPYTPSSGNVSILVCDQAGACHSATYDAALQTITFTAENAGTFTVSEQTEEAALSTPSESTAHHGNAVPFSIAGIVGMGVLLLAAGFLGVRRMRKGGHPHE